ncbi:MAG: putative metallopeptidase [Desulfobulbaceae bacterium]
MWQEDAYGVDLESVEVKNVTAGPDVAGGVAQGNTTWRGAPEGLCKLCQLIIDRVDDHRHLREARVLLLVKTNPADWKKQEKGERLVCGKASKANPLMRLLSRQERKAATPVDFVVWLNGVWLEAWEIVETDEHGRMALVAEGEALRKVTALIDHELAHCGAKICGKFKSPDLIKLEKDALGEDLVEVCEDVTDEDGNVLVRYYKKDAGRFVWCMRKHDLEEFVGIAGRHGAWAKNLKDLVDELVKSEKTLFAGVE